MTAGRFPYLPGVSAGQSSRNVEHLMMTMVTSRETELMNCHWEKLAA
jgi:hypothetical protein